MGVALLERGHVVQECLGGLIGQSYHALTIPKEKDFVGERRTLQAGMRGSSSALDGGGICGLGADVALLQCVSTKL